MISSTKDLYGAPKVGGDILSYCTKCKIELAHVIVSMIERRPAKVICKTCRSQHNYRRIGDITPRATRAGLAAPKKAPVVRVAELWEQRIAANKHGTAKPYSAANNYLKGEVIQHPKFGMGVVEEIKNRTKMSVLFRDGEKILVFTEAKLGANGGS